MAGSRIARAATLLALVTALGGCTLFKGKGGPKTPVLGERIPILAAETSAEVDPGVADVPVLLPPAQANDAWSQPGGSATKSMGNLALGAQVSRAWDVSIGRGGDMRARLAAAPVVAGKRIYTIDVDATVRAYDADTGATIWSSRLAAVGNRNQPSLFGGGVSIDGDRVFATNGVGDVGAFEAATGKLIWRQHPAGPIRGAPSIALGNIYVTTQDNQIFAIAEADGKVQWNEAATLETAGVFGAAAPAIAQGTVVAGFSSGELNAYRYENGRTVWEDALSRTSISTAVSSLSDIDADPVIDSGVVYAIGDGGRMVALGLTTGQRQWEVNIAGISTPWVAGDWLFVVTDNAQLLCVARATGKVRWISQLPHWHNDKKKTGLISWVGPLLAGDRLLLLSSEGALASVNPQTGKIVSTQETDKKGGHSLEPVIANKTLYILSDDGRLSAWR